MENFNIDKIKIEDSKENISKINESEESTVGEILDKGYISVNDFKAGFDNSYKKLFNVIPGIHKLEIQDKDSYAYAAGEFLGSFTNPALYAIPGAVEAKTATALGKLVGTGLSDSILAKSFTAGLGGVTFGLQDAYIEEQNNHKMDYKTSALAGGILGGIGGAVFAGISKIYKSNLGSALQELPEIEQKANEYHAGMVPSTGNGMLLEKDLRNILQDNHQLNTNTIKVYDTVSNESIKISDINQNNQNRIEKLANDLIDKGVDDPDKMLQHLTGHQALVTKEFEDYLWKLKPETLDALQTNDFNVYLKKGLKNSHLEAGQEHFIIPDEVKPIVDDAVNQINRLNQSIVQRWRANNYEIGYIEDYLGKLRHNYDLIINDKENWGKFIDEHTLVPLDNTGKDEFIKSLKDKDINTDVKLMQNYKLYSRFFKFKTPELENEYMQKYGFAYTPWQELKYMISANAHKLGAIEAYGKDFTDVINKIGEQKKIKLDYILNVKQKIFPPQIYSGQTISTIFNTINNSEKFIKLYTNAINPGNQLLKYGLGDNFNVLLRSWMESDMLTGTKAFFKSVTQKKPDFIKQIGKLSIFEKQSFKAFLQEARNNALIAKNSSHGFFEPKGVFDAWGSYANAATYKLNGSHEVDSFVRNNAIASLANIYKKAYEKNEPIKGFTKEILDKMVDEKGYLNPFKLLNSTNAEEVKAAKLMFSRYFDIAESINPLNSRLAGLTAKDNPGSLLHVRMSNWMTSVAARTSIPLLKQLVSSNNGTRIKAGSKLIAYALGLASIEESFHALDTWLDDKDYKFDDAKFAQNFFTAGILGGLYWNFKLSFNAINYTAQAGYYGAKGLFDERDSDKEFEDYTKAKENIKKAGGIFKYPAAIWHKLTN